MAKKEWMIKIGSEHCAYNLYQCTGKDECSWHEHKDGRHPCTFELCDKKTVAQPKPKKKWWQFWRS